MSDNESDYYSENSDSDSSSDEESVKVTNKKPINLNAVKPFGNYVEDDTEPSDSETDDNDDEDDENDDDKIGGGDDDDLESGEIKEPNENDTDSDNEDDIEIDEDGEPVEKPNSKQLKPVKPKKTTQLIIEDDDDDDDDEYEENYLQKFDNEINKNYISEFHPECLNHNSDEVARLTKVVRDENNIIIDTLHRTIPYLTKYEKARVLGQRAKQIETGAKPLVKVPENVIDSYVIAELELREKKIPFIIKRPIPGGKFEYWNLKDLENINF